MEIRVTAVSVRLRRQPMREFQALIRLAGGALLAVWILQPAVAAPPGAAKSPPAAAADQRRFHGAYWKLPLSFEPSPGQTVSETGFVARTPRYSVLLTPTGAVLSLEKAGGGAAVVRMKMLGSSSTAEPRGLDPLPGQSNYFLGNDPAQWRTGVPQYARVEYRGVYPGVNVVYYGTGRELEYDFVIAPGANAGVIRLAVEGARSLRVEGGDVVIRTDAGEIRNPRPKIYQLVDGVKRQIPGRYIVHRGHLLSFAVGRHDRTRPLVIDPTLTVTHGTLLDGRGDEIAFSLAVDSAGNIYATGFTTSIDFPTTPGAYRTTSPGAGARHVFVAKLNPTLTTLLYSTYLGGSGAETARAMAVDSSGNAYIAGYTNSANFPTTPGALQTTFGGGTCNNAPCPDAFIAKLNPTGSALAYSTFFGGNSLDEAFAMALDAAGSVYLTGITASANLRTTAGVVQPAFGGTVDAFLIKLNPAGTALVYATYLGGNDFDVGNGLAIDGSGNAYIAGDTYSLNFPTTLGAFQTTTKGTCGARPCDDAFVAKVNPTGSALIYSTFLGGSSGDFAQAIALDANGAAYVTGTTYSTDFPTTPGVLQRQYGGGGSDAFVAILDPTGASLLSSTFLGGSGAEFGEAILLASTGGVWVSVDTTSSNFPPALQALSALHQQTSGALPVEAASLRYPPKMREQQALAAQVLQNAASSPGVNSSRLSISPENSLSPVTQTSNPFRSSDIELSPRLEELLDEYESAIEEGDDSTAVLIEQDIVDEIFIIAAGLASPPYTDIPMDGYQPTGKGGQAAVIKGLKQLGKLKVTKSVKPAAPQSTPPNPNNIYLVDDRLTYTVVVSNTGQIPLNVLLTDAPRLQPSAGGPPLPGRAQLDGFTPTPQCGTTGPVSPVPPSFQCAFPLAVGASFTLTYTVRFETEGKWKNVAIALANGAAPASDTKTVQVLTAADQVGVAWKIINGADATQNPAVAPAGGNLDYQIVVTNSLHSATAVGVGLGHTPPTGLADSVASVNPAAAAAASIAAQVWPAQASLGTVSQGATASPMAARSQVCPPPIEGMFGCNLGSLAPGDIVTVNFHATNLHAGTYTLTGASNTQAMATAPPGIPVLLSYGPEIDLRVGANTLFSTVSDASFAPGAPVAPGTIAAGFGQGMAHDTQGATATPLPTKLAKTSVTVNSGATALQAGVIYQGGTGVLAPLFFVSPTQINYLVPLGTATGTATVTVTNDDLGLVAIGSIQVAAVAPALFSANSSGKGVAAAGAVRAAADGTQSSVPVYQCGSGGCTSVPIDLGGPSDVVVVVLYGSGLRGFSSLQNVTATAGGASAPVLFAGPQGTFVGLDQVNVQLPRTLIGRGEVDVVVTVDGKTSNTVTVNIQ